MKGDSHFPAIRGEGFYFISPLHEDANAKAGGARSAVRHSVANLAPIRLMNGYEMQRAIQRDEGGGEVDKLTFIPVHCFSQYLIT
jgi:hypothetical protein